MAKEKSIHAKTASAIRKELKEKFPKTKFSVTSRSFAGGDAVDVSWDNGVTADKVKKVIDKYQYGHFNGMNDSYEYSNTRDDIPQVKYVMQQRDISDNVRKQAKAYIDKKYGKDVDEEYKRDKANRLLSELDLTDGFDNAIKEYEKKKIEEEKEYQKSIKEQEIKDKENQKKYEEQQKQHEKEKEEADLDNIQSYHIPDETIYIDVKYPNLNKNETLKRYKEELQKHYFESKTMIRKIIVANQKQWDFITNGFLDYLPDLWEKIGGSGTNDRISKKYNIPTEFQEFHVWLQDPENKKIYQENKFLFGVLVFNKDTKESIVVDSEGYDYARYVGFPKISKDEVAKIVENVIVNEKFKNANEKIEDTNENKIKSLLEKIDFSNVPDDIKSEFDIIKKETNDYTENLKVWENNFLELFDILKLIPNAIKEEKKVEKPEIPKVEVTKKQETTKEKTETPKPKEKKKNSEHQKTEKTKRKNQKKTTKKEPQYKVGDKVYSEIVEEEGTITEVEKTKKGYLYTIDFGDDEGEIVDDGEYIKPVENKKEQKKEAKKDIDCGKYVLGMRWSEDFPYDDMLKCGKKTSVDWGVEKLRELAESYQDVNYHKVSHNLWEAIKYLEKNDTEKAKESLLQFHKDIDKEFREKARRIFMEFKKPTPPSSLFKPKKLSTAINRSKIWLKSKAEKYGVWENFGQDIVGKLEDTYIDISSYTDEMNNRRNMIQEFNEWCSTFS